MDIELLQKIHFLNNLILPKFPKIYLKTHKTNEWKNNVSLSKEKNIYEL